MKKGRTSLLKPRKAKPDKGKATKEMTKNSDLSALSLRDFVQLHGTEELRRLLERFTTKDLRSYVRSENLSRTAPSALTKDDAINRILGAAKRAA